MRKSFLVFVLLVVVTAALSSSHHEKRHPPDMPEPPEQSVNEARRFTREIVNHRVTRQISMPSLDQIKQMGREMINKLRPQMQAAARKAREMAKEMMPGLF